MSVQLESRVYGAVLWSESQLRLCLDGSRSAVLCGEVFVIFILLYNREVKPQVSGGCIGILYFYVSCECIL